LSFEGLTPRSAFVVQTLQNKGCDSYKKFSSALIAELGLFLQTMSAMSREVDFDGAVKVGSLQSMEKEVMRDRIIVPGIGLLPRARQIISAGGATREAGLQKVNPRS
jgi:hypothetical protein